VRTRSEEFVRTIDELVIPVPVDVDRELPEAQATPILREILQAVDDLERLLGEALEGGPRQRDLHGRLDFAEPHAVLKYAQRTGRVAKNVALEIKRDEDLPEQAERERRYLDHGELLMLARATDRFETLTLVPGYWAYGLVRLLH
jgi:hypothetical protein